MSSDGQSSKGSLVPILGVIAIAGVVGAMAWFLSGGGSSSEKEADQSQTQDSTDDKGSEAAVTSSNSGGVTRSETRKMRPPLTVSVLDESQAPISGADVAVFEGKFVSQAMENCLKKYKTDAKGQVLVDAPILDSWITAQSDGNFRVIAELKDFAQNRIEFVLSSGAAVKVKTIEDNSDVGTPLEGFLIRLHSGVSGPPPQRSFLIESLTGPDGVASFPTVPTDEIMVILDTPEFDFKNEKVQIPKGQEKELIFRLNRKTSVPGIVVSAKDGLPVSGALVRCSPNASPEALEAFSAAGNLISSATTDESGQFIMNNVGHGTIHFSVSADGFAKDAVAVEIARGDDGPIITQNGQALKLIRIQLPPASTISGIVMDVNRQPIGGINVSIDNPLIAIFKEQGGDAKSESFQVKSDKAGRFEFKNVLPRTPWIVSAIDPQFIPDKTEPIQLLPGENKTDVILTLRKGGLITGEVVDSQGQPLPGATVSAYERPNSPPTRRPPDVKSAADGSFRLAKVPEGIFMVTGSLEGYVDTTRSGVRHTATGVQIQLRKSAALSGVVINGETQLPITHFSVRHRPSGLTAGRADEQKSFESEDGTFTISNVTPGILDLEVRAESFAHAVKFGVPVREGETAGPIEMILDRGAYIEGLVTDIQGNPVPRAVVELNPDDRFDHRDRDYNLLRVGANELGHYRIGQLQEGNYEFTVIHNKYAQLRPEKVFIRTGEPNTRDVTLLEGAKVIVYVYDPNGEPIEGARALLRDKALPPPMGSPQSGGSNIRREPFRSIDGVMTGAGGRNTSDRNGRILFYRQPAGEFALSVYAPGYKSFRKPMTLEFGQTYEVRADLVPADDASDTGDGDGQ